ncbi:MAG: hypothetical protein NUV56_02825 [Candidatus Uhrbacteria bacterium]|nr:hypothetical protein [Candidatus Uhrbacteria bacterium]
MNLIRNRNTKMALFNKLWDTSSNTISKIAMPPRSKITVRLPSPGWYYILESMHLRLNNRQAIFLEPYWEDEEIMTELALEEGCRYVIGIQPHDHKPTRTVLEELMNGIEPIPEPDRIFRWEITSN